MRHRMDIKATRDGEGAEATHTDEQVEESKELISPKRDQVDQVEGGDTDDKGKEDAKVQGHGFDTNEEPAELIGNRRRYGKEERQAQVQGHRIDTNEEPAERSANRRRYNEKDCLQVKTEGVMRFTQQDRKNLQEVVTKQDQVDQVEGGDADDKGKGGRRPPARAVTPRRRRR